MNHNPLSSDGQNVIAIFETDDERFQKIEIKMNMKEFMAHAAYSKVCRNEFVVNGDFFKNNLTVSSKKRVKDNKEVNVILMS